MMRSLVCSSLTLVGMSAALAPVVAHAQAAAPAGYAPAATNGVMMMGMDGKPVAVQPVMAVQPAPASAPAPHTHKFRTMCANCMKKQQAVPVERIIACAHSKNGVCPTCQALLAMPGPVTMGAAAPTPTPGAEAPGRAMVSSTPSQAGANQLATQSAVYDPSNTPEPTPVGVMQTNYAQPGAAPAAPSSIPTASSLQPGHAIAAAGPGANPAPFQHKPTSSKNPHIIGHILGYSGIGSEWRDQRAQKKVQAHASIPYNNEGTTVNELPASMVFGRQN